MYCFDCRRPFSSIPPTPDPLTIAATKPALVPNVAIPGLPHHLFKQADISVFFFFFFLSPHFWSAFFPSNHIFPTKKSLFYPSHPHKFFFSPPKPKNEPCVQRGIFFFFLFLVHTHTHTHRSHDQKKEGKKRGCVNHKKTERKKKKG